MPRDTSIPPRSRAIVAGAGFGGIAAALRLRARGHDVHLIDRCARLGGRGQVFEHEGFRHDAGPTVLTAPFLFEELFALFGKRMSDYVELVEPDPWYRFHYHDGETFDYGPTEADTEAEIARLSPRDVAGYRRMGAWSKKIYDIGFLRLSTAPFHSVGFMLKQIPHLLRLRSYESVWGMVSRFIKDDRLRRAFSIQPLLVGGNPFDTTAIYGMINHLERTHGVWFPKGGTGALVDALETLMREEGIRISLNTTIERIRVEDGRASGVVLEGGRALDADLVVSNMDPVHVYRHMLPADLPSPVAKLRSKHGRLSMGLYVLFFGANRSWPEVAHHTVWFGERYKSLLARHLPPQGAGRGFLALRPPPDRHRPELCARGLRQLLRALPGAQSRRRAGLVGRGTQAARPHRQSTRRVDDAGPLGDDHGGVRDDARGFQIRLPVGGRGGVFALAVLHAIGVVSVPQPRRGGGRALFRGRGHASRRGPAGRGLVGQGARHGGAGAGGEAARDGDRRMSPEDVMTRHARSFAPASRLLGRSDRARIARLYALCRTVDDLADTVGGPEVAARLDRLARDLDDERSADPLAIEAQALFAGRPAGPRGVPASRRDGGAGHRRHADRRRGRVRPLLSRRRRDRGPDGLRALRYRPALARGRGRSGQGDADHQYLPRRARRCRGGRRYLPGTLCPHAPAVIARAATQPEVAADLREAVAHLLARADALYGSGRSGLPALPLRLRLAVAAAARMYAGIGDGLRARHCDPLPGRVYVPARRKIGLASAGMLASLWPVARMQPGGRHAAT